MKKIIIATLLLFISSICFSKEFLTFTATSVGASPTGYIIYFDLSSKNPVETSEFSYHKNIGLQTEYPVSDLNLSAGVEYVFIVTAYNTVMESAQSNRLIVTKKAFVPPMDSLPVSTNISETVSISFVNRQ